MDKVTYINNLIDYLNNYRYKYKGNLIRYLELDEDNSSIRVIYDDSINTRDRIEFNDLLKLEVLDKIGYMNYHPTDLMKVIDRDTFDHNNIAEVRELADALLMNDLFGYYDELCKMCDDILPNVNKNFINI